MGLPGLLQLRMQVGQRTDVELAVRLSITINEAALQTKATISSKAAETHHFVVWQMRNVEEIHKFPREMVLEIIEAVGKMDLLRAYQTLVVDA